MMTTIYLNPVVTAEEAEAIRHAIESPPPAPEPVLLAAPVSVQPQSEPEILQTNLERIEKEMLASVKSNAAKGKKVLDDGEKRLQEDRVKIKKAAEKKVRPFSTSSYLKEVLTKPHTD